MQYKQQGTHRGGREREKVRVGYIYVCARAREREGRAPSLGDLSVLLCPKQKHPSVFLFFILPSLSFPPGQQQEMERVEKTLRHEGKAHTQTAETDIALIHVIISKVCERESVRACVRACLQICA